MKIVANTESVEVSLDVKEVKEFGKDKKNLETISAAVNKMQKEYIEAKITAEREYDEKMMEARKSVNEAVYEYQKTIQKKENRNRTLNTLATNVVRISVGAGIIYTILNKDTLKSKFFGKKK